MKRSVPQFLCFVMENKNTELVPEVFLISTFFKNFILTLYLRFLEHFK